jgi:hypothetical protein
MAGHRVDATTTMALRTGSVDALRQGFEAHVASLWDLPKWDSRDEMLSLAAFLDCARRLGQEPDALFGPTAASGPPWFVETFTTFVRRTDVTLAAFGWSIVETPDGPAYRFAWPRFKPVERRPSESSG